ncbi:MAG: GxxExxY protein [Balneolaceae bacterium]|nr:GxxExxY protein [Balneolaceae bacterium]
MNLNNITDKIIGASIEVHRKLGPGLLESAYHRCLFYELNMIGLMVKEEIPMPIIYKEVHLDHGYRLDLLIEDKVVVEIKTVDCFTDVHIAQLLTYLKLGDFHLGLLINFNVGLLKDGIKRLINKPNQ